MAYVLQAPAMTRSPRRPIATDLNRLNSRLRELEQLPPNWDDEGGASIARQALDATRHLLKVRPRLRAAYKLFPTRIGGLLVEFIVNGWDLSVEFGPDGGIELFGFEVDGDRELLPRQFTQLGSEFLEAFDKASGGKWQSD